MAVRPESEPKSGRPRRDTDEGELEQYGVWVKAEPQDIAAEPEVSNGMDGDFDLPEDGESLPEESFLTAEEERLLGSFGDIEASESSLNESEKESATAIPEPDTDFSSLPDMEDFEAPKIDDFAAAAEGPSAKEGLEPSMDLIMDDLGAGFTEPSFGPGSELDMSDVVGLEGGTGDRTASIVADDDFDIPLEETLTEDVILGEDKEESRLGKVTSGPELEDVSADFLDLEVAPVQGSGHKEAAKPSGSPTADVTSEFLTEGEGGHANAHEMVSEEANFEPLDIELQFDDTLPSSGDLPSSGQGESHLEAGFEDISDFDDYLKEEPAEKTSEGFDDLAALEQELSDEAPRTGPAGASKVAAAQPSSANQEVNLSNELLLKIATELSSIRSELVTLKAQLGAARMESPIPAPIVAESEEPSSISGGFFDDEDDEKIALTGDELDNILNSAAFTEETPVEAGAPGESIDIFGAIDQEIADSFTPKVSQPGDFLDEGILPESGDYSNEPKVEAPIERISLEEEKPGEIAPSSIPEDEGPVSSAFKRIADKGIIPLTPPPEDTAYLEEPLLPESVLDLGETPLVEAPLVEPDLSDLSLELPASGEDMDLSGDLPLDEVEEILPDMTLDMPATSKPFVMEAIDVPSTSGAIPEFEESEYEEISLIHEDMLKPAEPDETESFVEFIEEELPEEDVLHHEDISASSDTLIEGEALDETEVEDLAFHPDEVSESLDENLFVPSPEGLPSAAEDEGGVHLSSNLAGAEEIVDETDLVTEMENEVLPARARDSDQAARTQAISPADGEAERLKSDIRSVLSYLDRLLESLPEEKIEEFAHSEHFDTYKKLFEELGLV